VLDWLSPLWLVAAGAAIPLVWWLHRLHRPEHPHAVSAIFLWQDHAIDITEGARSRTADPRWRLRALIVTSLCIAAAQPGCSGSAAPVVEVWFDDTLSMQTKEAEGTRADSGIAALTQELTKVAPGRVIVRSMGNPGRTLVLDSHSPETWPETLRDWLRLDSYAPILPLEIEMKEHAEHWVVTDGADATLAPWLASGRVGKVIQVGAETENVAVTGLSLRRSLADPEVVVGLIHVTNVGNEPARRELNLVAGDREIERSELNLVPGEKHGRSFQVRSSGNEPIRSVISPPDALAADDALVVDPRPIARVIVGVHGTCGAEMTAALQAHPGVRLAGPTDSEISLIVTCGQDQPVAKVPGIWFRSVKIVKPLTAPPVWHADAGSLGRLILDPQWLSQPEMVSDDPVVMPLLSAGGAPLIVARESPTRLIEVRFDPKSSGLTERPEYPVLVAGLLDLAAGRSLLDEYVEASRPETASVIAPNVLEASAPAPTPYGLVRSQDLTPYVIAAAMILLFLDAFALLKRFRVVGRARSGMGANPLEEK